VIAVLWVLPLICAAVGMVVLAWCALRVRREVDPTYRSIDRFGRELRPALVRVRDETARARRRLDPDA
jgi:DNA-binding IclR family transcriptional regulator